MSTSAATTDSFPSPAASSVPKLSRVFRFIVWLILGISGSLCLAWLSLKLQWAGLAPLILFSLLVGGACGGILILLARVLGSGHKGAMLIASVFLGLLTASMQHVFAYQAYRQAFEQSVRSNPKAALAKSFNPDFGPASFTRYMQAEGRKQGYLLMWSIDATLIVLATVGVLWLGTLRTYCPHCGRWHQLTRRGPLPEKFAASWNRLADLSGIKLNNAPNLVAGQYEFWHCLCRRSPLLLKLSLIDPQGKKTNSSLQFPAQNLKECETLLRLEPVDSGNSPDP